MKSIILSLAALLVVSGCTQQSNNPNNSSDVQESVMVLEAKSGIVTGTAEFGSFEVGATATKLVSFTLKNNGTESLNGTASLNDSTQGFSLAYSNCPASLAINKSCTLKVLFTPKNLTAGPKAASLMFDSVFVSLTATMTALDGAPSSDYLVNYSVVTSLNFGQLTSTQSIMKTISIKNTGNAPISETVTLSGDYVLSYDACSGKAIAKSASCSVKVTLNAAGKSGVVTGSLVYAGKTLSLTGEIIVPSSLSNVVLMNGSGVISTYDFGLVTGTESKQLVLVIKNTGTGTSAAATAALNGSDFSIVYNQCSASSLAPGASCQVRVLFAASGKASATYSSTLSFGDKTLPLVAKVPLTCQSGFHVEADVCVNNTKVCDVLPNGFLSGTQTWANNQYGSCVAQSCAPDFALSGATCLPVGIGNYLDIINVTAPVSVTVTNGFNSVVNSAVSSSGGGVILSGTGQGSTGAGVNPVNKLLAVFNPYATPLLLSLDFVTPFSVQGTNLGTVNGNQGYAYLNRAALSLETSVNVTTSSGVSNWPVRKYSMTQYDIRPGMEDLDYSNSFVSFNNALYFPTYSGSGYSIKLMKLKPDGSIVQVSNINEGSSDNISFQYGTNYTYPAILNNELYFVSSNNLYKIDTNDVITKVTNGGLSPVNLTVFDNAIYFNSGYYGDIYKVSSAGALSRITITTSANFGGGGTILGVFNNYLYAGMSVGGYKKLVKISTAGAITVLSNVNGTGNNDMPERFAVFNNEAYFKMLKSDQNGFFKINAADQISAVANLNPNYPVTGLITYGDNLYFSQYGEGWFKLNAQGNIQRLNYDYNLDSFKPTIIKNELYFNGNGTLYKMNAGGNFLTRLSNGGQGISYVGKGLGFLNDKIYFSAYDSTNSYMKIYAMQAQ